MRIRATVVLWVALLTVGAEVFAAEPRISFEEQAVVVEGLAAEAEAVLLGVGRGVAGFVPYQMSVAEVVAADDAGAARLELGEPLPTISVWVAVALADGGYALAAPEGSEVRQVALPKRAIPASLARLEDTRRSLQVLWVRPAGDPPSAGAGGWTARVVDGSGLDGDSAEDRRLSVVLDLLEPLGTSPPPRAPVISGDVLVGIDLDTLEVYAVRLGA